MKININVQNVCVPDKDYRGIPYYTTEVIRALINRNNNKYAVSFFDYNKERNNRQYLDRYFKDFIEKIEIHECNELNFMNVFKGIETKNPSLYNQKSYGEYVSDSPDIYFFPYSGHVPENITDGKVVVTVHDIIPYLEEAKKTLAQYEIDRFKNSIDYIASRDEYKIVAISEYTKTDLVNIVGIKPERIFVVPNAYNSQLYFNQKDSSILKKFGITKPFILYLGALSPRKGIATLLESMRFVKEKDFQIVLAGAPTKYMDVNELISHSDRKDDFILTGYVSDEEKRVLLSSAEIFVFPSVYEGFGLPVIEAMACGTPVITTTATSLPEVGGDAAVYFSPNDSEELAKRIDDFIADNELRQKYSDYGINRSKLFSWETVAEKMETIFKSL